MNCDRTPARRVRAAETPHIYQLTSRPESSEEEPVQAPVCSVTVETHNLTQLSELMFKTGQIWRTKTAKIKH